MMSKKNIVEEIYLNSQKFSQEELEHHTKVALRELALEEVRNCEYPMFPSRMSSLYVSNTLEEAEKWFDFFTELGRPTFQIVKLKATGRVFEGNANRCFDGTTDKSRNMELAKEYWKNKAANDQPVVEVLVDGDIEVLEIIKQK